MIANRNLQAKLKLSKHQPKFGGYFLWPDELSKQEDEQYEYQHLVAKPASLLDRIEARPFAYIAGCCAIASLATVSIMFAFH